MNVPSLPDKETFLKKLRDRYAYSIKEGKMATSHWGTVGVEEIYSLLEKCLEQPTNSSVGIVDAWLRSL